jgi:tetratricopeptide (TPR) repeat protein
VTGDRPPGYLPALSALPPPVPPASRPGPSRAWLVLAGVLLATALAYVRSLSGELVYDDRLLIARNPLIADLGNLPRLLVSGYWDFLAQEHAEHIGYWRPLTAILQALAWAVGGSDPLPYHVLCVGVHLVAVAASFFLALGLTGRTWIAAVTALLFGLHPAHVESVAWISALNDPLFGALTLVALERFLAWRRRGSRGLPLAASLAFALALLSKEMGAALLPLLLVLDLLRPETEDRRWIGPLSLPTAPDRAWGPFAAVFGLYLVARMFVFESPFAGFDRVTTDFAVSAARLALLRVELLGGSLEILSLPIHLNLFRPFRPHVALLDPLVVRATVFSLVFLALVVRAWRKRSRTLLLALACIPAGLLPALVRVESLGVFPLSERFLYLPVFGFALAVALGLERWLSPRRAIPVGLVLAGLYAARTVDRIGFWHDEETLFRTAAADSPRSVYVKWSLGRVLLEKATAERDPEVLKEAFAVFEAAQDLLIEARQPDTDLMVSSRDYLQANLGLAWCYIDEAGFDTQGNASAAVALLEDLSKRVEALQQEQRAAEELGIAVRDQYLDLDLVYTALGVAYTKADRFEDAERAFEKALAFQPSVPETRQNLGRLYARMERWPEAAEQFEKAAALRPGNAEDRLLLAQALVTMDQDRRTAASPWWSWPPPRSSVASRRSRCAGSHRPWRWTRAMDWSGTRRPAHTSCWASSTTPSRPSARRSSCSRRASRPTTTSRPSC